MESQHEPPLLSQDKPVDIMDCSEKLDDFCLICFSKVDRSKLPKQNSLLSNNLNAIFLLKNLLQVPSDLLIGNFKKCGSPAYWINLCENCSQLTSQAMEHHLQILKLVNQLRSVLKIITEKMRESHGPSETLTSYRDDNIEDNNKKSMQEKRLHILTTTREFVTNYDYNTHLANPFIEGDKLARELDDDQDSSSSENSEEEDDGSDECGGGWQDEDFEGPEIEAEAPSSNTVAPEYEIVDGFWKCRYCDKLFERKYSLRIHEMGRHPSVPGQFKCDICGKKINSQYHLNRHKKISHKPNATGIPNVKPEGKWKCPHCNKSFLTKSGLYGHEDEKHPEVPGKFECEICGKIYNSKFYLSSHRRQVHKIKTVRSSTRIFRRRRGRPPAPKIDKWTSQHCGKIFRNKYHFTRHEREQHPSIPGQFKCDICGNTKNSRFGLLLHRRSVHRINAAGNPVKVKPRDYSKEKRKVKPKDPSTCHLCGKGFGWVDQLRKHIKYFHEKKFDIHCHVCGMGVYTTYNLNVHLLKKHKDDPVTLKLIEEGVRIWKCGVVGCRADYLKESGLEEHTKRVHGGGGGGNGEEDAKRFTCAFCGKTFWYWHKLKVHEIKHKVEKEFCCDVCGAKLKRKSSIKKHKMRYHSEVTT